MSATEGFDLDLTGETLQERYRVTIAIGEGGMGRVYLATDEHLARPVVVKVPHVQHLANPEFRTRFEREIRSLIRLDHPHVVKVLDVGSVRGVPYAVLQHLGGGSLEDRLHASGRRQTPAEVLEWLPPVAAALDFIHARGFIHRDVKPGNIMFDEAGFPFLGDFGIARVLGDADTGITQTGVTPGSPKYMAPEAALGQPLGPAYDQYALAVVVFRALSGGLPHEATTPLALLTAKATKSPRPLAEAAPGLPPSCTRAVMDALATEPGGRFASCSAFVAAFRSDVDGGATLPAPGAGSYDRTRTVVSPEATTTLPPLAARPAEGRGLFAPLVAAAIVVIGGGAWIGWRAIEPGLAGATTAALPERPPREALPDVAARAEPEASAPQDDGSTNASESASTDEFPAPAGAALAAPGTSEPAPPRDAGAPSATDPPGAGASGASEPPSIGDEKAASAKAPPAPAPPDAGAAATPPVSPPQAAVAAAAAPPTSRAASGQAASETSERGGSASEAVGSGPAPRAGEVARPAAREREVQADAPALATEAKEPERSAGGGAPSAEEGAKPDPVAAGPLGPPKVQELAPAGALRPAGTNARSLPVSVRLRDGATMVRIPGGTFEMGSLDTEAPDERPLRAVTLSPYLLDVREVTWGQWDAYLRVTRGSLVWSRPQSWKPTPEHPVVNVTWEDAAKYCAWVGGRLPTEAEWELAARGTSSLRFPWGQEWMPDAANAQGADDGFEHAAPVGSYVAGASPYGVLDLAGNVAEWTADWYDPAGYPGEPATDPKGPTTGTQRAQRGGDYSVPPGPGLRAANRQGRTPTDVRASLGFRCALDP